MMPKRNGCPDGRYKSKHRLIIMPKIIYANSFSVTRLNEATESSGDRYPDGGSCIVSQRQISCCTGFCEVKAGYMKNNTVSTHLDLLRLCIFGKDTIDNEDLENAVLLEAVGKCSICYLLLYCIYI